MKTNLAPVAVACMGLADLFVRDANELTSQHPKLAKRLRTAAKEIRAEATATNTKRRGVR